MDGGGIRSYSSLLILKKLMDMITSHERRVLPLACRSSDSLGTTNAQHDYDSDSDPDGFRLCHYFDYISGTSTGGVIAVLLGRLRLSTEAAERIFVAVYSTSCDPGSPLLPRSLTSRKKRESLGKLIGKLQPAQASEGEDNTDFRSDTLQCRTIVCSMRESKNFKGDIRPCLFRSYEPLSSNDTPLSLAQVVQATVTVSSYFDPVRIGGSRFVDATTTLNNPSLAVLTEVKTLHIDIEQHIQPIHLFLSLGCGSKQNEATIMPCGYKAWDIRQADDGLDKHIDAISDLVHQRMVDEGQYADFEYFRFDVRRRRGDVTSQPQKTKRNNHYTLEKLRKITEAYLREVPVYEELESLARTLVERRRQRAQTQRWEGYAFGTRYRCTVHPCSHESSNGRPFPSENALLDHFERDHDMAPISPKNEIFIRGLLDKGRTSSKPTTR